MGWLEREVRPPRVASWLLSRLLPGADSAYVCDDVAERFRREILPSSGPVRARLWYWGEVFRSVGPALRLRLLRFLFLLLRLFRLLFLLLRLLWLLFLWLRVL